MDSVRADAGPNWASLPAMPVGAVAFTRSLEGRTSLGRAGRFAALLHGERLPRATALPDWFRHALPPGDPRGGIGRSLRPLSSLNRPRLVTGASVRRVLGRAGAGAATVGSTIFLPGPPERSAHGAELLGHETAHALSWPAAPRFFLDGLLDSGERAARTFGRRARTFVDDERHRGEAMVRRRLRDAQGSLDAALQDQGLPTTSDLSRFGGAPRRRGAGGRANAASAPSDLAALGHQEFEGLEQRATTVGAGALGEARSWAEGLAGGLGSRARQSADELGARGSNALGAAGSILQRALGAAPPSVGSALRSASDMARSALGSRDGAAPDTAAVDPTAVLGRSLGGLLGSRSTDADTRRNVASDAMKAVSTLVQGQLPPALGSMAEQGQELFGRVTGLATGPATPRTSARGRAGQPQGSPFDEILGPNAAPAASDLLGGVLNQLPSRSSVAAALQNLAAPDVPGASSLPVGGLAGMAASGFDAANAFAARARERAASAGGALDQVTGGARDLLGSALQQGTQAAHGAQGRASSALAGIEGFGRKTEGSLHHAADQGMARAGSVLSEAGAAAGHAADQAGQAFGATVERATSGLAAITGSVASAATDPHSQMGELLEVLEERLLAELERRGGRYAGVF